MGLAELIQQNMFLLLAGFFIPCMISCAVIACRTRKLYKLSLQKGLHYLSVAFASLTIVFLAFFIPTLGREFLNPALFEQGTVLSLIFDFLTIAGGAFGGFFLAYSIMWKDFCKRKIKKDTFSFYLTIITIASIIGLIDILLFILVNQPAPTIMFSFSIILLLIAVIGSHKRHKKKVEKGRKYKLSDSYYLVVGLGLIIYISTFVSHIIDEKMIVISFILWYFQAILFVIAMIRVLHLSRGI